MGDGAAGVAADVAVVGLGRRGLQLARWCARVGLRVAWLCERDGAALERASAEFPGARTARDWPELFAPAERGELGGVVLANDFDAHAAPSIAFLDRGVHVLSECAACADAEEGGRLLAAVARSTASWSFAENYVAHPHVRLIASALAAGEAGAPRLLECDYLHGLSEAALRDMTGDPGHWRGRIGPTAYCTHTVTPVLDVTGARPVEVTTHPVDGGERPAAVVMALRLSGGELALLRQTFLQGEPDSHWSWLSVRGTRGLVESVRAPGAGAWSVRVRNEPWAHGGSLRDEVRTPPELRLGGAPVERMEEGTALLVDAFRRSVTEGAPPRVPAGTAVAATLVGPAAAESLARGSVPVRVPEAAVSARG
ncbi:gfo/Idh/MocA family oxidoreductase [Streptomyces sp. ODS28]|uniref:Gfo/Idh/MocA family protein n=1 Tax=Streptomyces sp. ODS28 TaxID=3136688 RepID=UPI0031E80D97